MRTLVPAIGRAWSGPRQDWRNIYPVGAPAVQRFLQCACALASCGRGQSNTTALPAELEHLREEGERLGLQVALPEIVKAIEEMRG